MNRATFAGLAVAAAALPLRASAQSVQTLQLASAPVEDALAALLGQQTGAFQRAGIVVDIQKSNSGSAVAAAVASGAIDIGKTNIYSLINAHVKGVPFTILAPAAIYNADAPVTGLIVPHDSPMKTSADLTGKTVAVTGLDDMSAISVRAWIDHNGGDSTAVKFLEVPAPAIADAVASKRVDAGVIVNPALSEAIASGGVRLGGHPFDVLGRRFVWAVYFTTTQWAAKNRAAANAFKHVIAQTGQYANDHPDATVDLVAHFTGIDPTVIRSMTRTTIGTTTQPRLIQPLIDAFAAYHQIPAAFDARDIIDQG
jgi:NitT/TauT family transport system substrate-binding protein